MKLIDYLSEIDWNSDANKKIAEDLIADAEIYLQRVEAHIFGGNEIRADAFMNISEKQDAIRRLDRKRTEAHNKMLESFSPLLDLLRDNTSFRESEWKLANRTQIADFVAEIAFGSLDMEPSSRIEGDIRDELAEKLHKKQITYDQIKTEIEKLASE